MYETIFINQERGEIHAMEVCGVPTKTPAEAAEAAEDADGKPEKSGVSSHLPTAKIGLRRIPPAREKRWKIVIVQWV